MRGLTSDEKANSALEVTYRGWLLALTPTTLSPVYLSTIGADFTDGSSPGRVYLGDPGFVMGSARFTDGSDPASLALQIPAADGGLIDPDNVTAGLYQGAEVELRIVDYENGDVSPAIGFKWVVGATRVTNDGQAIFEIRAATRINRELILKIFHPLCPYNLGDSRCGVNMASFTDTVEVDSVTSLYEFTITGSSRADGYFDNGAIKFTSGGNAERAYTVRRWTLSTRKVLLWEPLRVELAIGDDATIHAGDDKTRATCHSKFNNIARFGGFPDMPPDDAKFCHVVEPVEEVAEETVTEPAPPRFAASTADPFYLPVGTIGGWYGS